MVSSPSAAALPAAPIESEKERKAREKAEKKEQQDREKKDRDQKLLVTRTLSKVVMPMSKLEMALNAPGVGKLPKEVQEHANGLMQKMKEMKRTADKISKGKLPSSAFTWTAQEPTSHFWGSCGPYPPGGTHRIDDLSRGVSKSMGPPGG